MNLRSSSKISKEDYDEFLKALKNKRYPRNERGQWLSSCLILKCLEENSGLTEYEAFIKVFSNVLDSLRAQNSELANILQWRFWDNLSFKQIREPDRFWSYEDTPSERTLSARQEQAIKDFAFLFLEKEKACQEKLRMLSEKTEKKNNEQEIEQNESVFFDLSTNNHRSFAIRWIHNHFAWVSICIILLVITSSYLMISNNRNSSAQQSTFGALSQITSIPSPTSTAFTSITSLEVAPSLCGEASTVKDIPTKQRFLRSQGVSSFRIDNTSGGILNNRVRAVASDKNGVWIGYFDSNNNSFNGISHLDISKDQKIWTYCDQPRLIRDKLVNDIAIDQSGQVWFATDGDGVLTLAQGSWYTYTTSNSNLPSNATYEVTIDQDDNIWVGTWAGVAKFDKSVDRWDLKYNITNGLFSNQVHAIAFDSIGDIWVGHISDGISQFHNETGKWTQHKKRQGGIGGDQIRRIVVRPADDVFNESVWFATKDGGVSKFEQEQWTVYSIEDGLPSQAVESVAIDIHNRMWATTDKGVAFLDGQRWVQYNDIDTLAISFGLDCQDQTCPSDSHIWMGTEKFGLTHSRLPYPGPAIDVIQVCFESLNEEQVCQVPTEFTHTNTITFTYPKITAPKEKFYFAITVKPRSPYQLRSDRGDFLSNIAKDDMDLFGTYPIIPVKKIVDPGQPFTFIDYDNPLQSPQLLEGEKQKTFVSSWRVWMYTRYVGPIINIVFTVQKP